VGEREREKGGERREGEKGGKGREREVREGRGREKGWEERERDGREEGTGMGPQFKKNNPPPVIKSLHRYCVVTIINLWLLFLEIEIWLT